MGERAVNADLLSSVDSPARAGASRRRRGGFSRWAIRLLTLAILLVVAIAICLQILLWTDIPRTLVLNTLQSALGLRVSAARMTIGWTGQTSLEDVKIALPLAEHSFLDVPRMEVTHTSLPMIMLTQDVTLKDVIFHQPSVLITQEIGGQWNVAEAVELITRAGGKKQAQDQPNKPTVLPKITVDRGVLRLVDRNGKTATVQPLNVIGQPDGPLVWKYDVRVEDRLQLTGQVSPGGLWQHEVAFEVKQIAPWLSPWTTALPDIRLAGNWRGQLSDAGLGGRVMFDELAVGSINASGAATVRRDEAGQITLLPGSLVIVTHSVSAPAVTMNAGAIVLSSTSASVKDLGVLINGGEARLNGDYSWGEQSATLAAAWRDIAFPQGVVHKGTATAKFSQPWPGAPHLEATAESSGKSDSGGWNAQLAIVGNGRSWEDIDWNTNVSRAVWTGSRSAEIQDLKTVVLMRKNLFTLQSVSVGAGAGAVSNLSGSGQYDASNSTWKLKLDGGHIPIHQINDAPLAFRLRAAGSAEKASLEDLSITSGEVEVQGDGEWDKALPKPFSFNLVLSHLPALEGSDPQSILRGRLYGKMSVSGTASPLNLAIDQGVLYGSNVSIGRRDIGRIAIQLAGQITSTQANIETTEALLLGGKWRFRADWPEEDESLRVGVRVRDLPVAEIGDLLQQKNLSGTASGAWTITVPSTDKTRITSTGDTEIHDLVVGLFRVDRVTAHSNFDHGKVVLDPIRLEEKGGSADAHLDLLTSQPARLNVTADVRNWPATAPSGNAAALLSAQAALAIDLASQSATGPMKAQLAFTVNQRDAGTLSIDSTLAGRTLNITQLDAAALGGSAYGAGTLPLDQPMKSVANLAWENLNGAELSAFVPGAVGLAGTMSGSADLLPSDDPRAVGPLKLTANIVSDGLRFRSIDLGNSNVVSYFTGSRFVLDDATVNAAGGQLHFWARTTTHEGGVRSSQLQIDFKNLDLDRIDQAFDTKPRPMPGKLAGSVVVIGSIQDRSTLFGEGDVQISESNLVNLGAIRGLYDLMHIGQSGNVNDGTGAFSVRLDNSTITLDNARYFNRGVQARAQATLHNIWNAPDSPIDGTVIGSIRPLKDVKLPYFADADSILNALQQNLTSVKIEGTAREYHVVPITLSETGETMRKILLGEVQK